LDALRWNDRVYGPSVIDDPGILTIVNCPTFQRLRRIRQAGPSSMAYPFKTVSRFEHSVGVYLLLKRLGAEPIELVAGLLHDISHTAFSHAVDFVFSSEEQDHHERLKPEFLQREDLKSALLGLGFVPEEFYDDSIYPLLERPIPWLCADRLDYFFRDGLACGETTSAWVAEALEDLSVIGQTIVFDDVRIARQAVEAFGAMNRDWWASPTESYIYNEFADALREGFRLGVLNRESLLGDDDEVLTRLRSAGSPLIDQKLALIAEFKPERLVGYVERISPKMRWLDPPVAVEGGSGSPRTWRKLSEW
jgi:HD superfamily phosphohydrolase